MSVVVFITFYDHYGCHGNVSVATVKQHEVERVLTLAVDWLNIWMEIGGVLQHRKVLNTCETNETAKYTTLNGTQLMVV